MHRWAVRLRMPKGTAHEWTHDEAVSAGRRGGTSAARRRYEAERQQSDDVLLKMVDTFATDVERQRREKAQE